MDSHVENKLKEIRMRAGLTQEGLADAIGVSRQTIISIEKGKYVPSVALALKIARRFNLTVEDIFR
ncbi:MAG: helix-turn-helix transcriptional regulator [Patescibacteria group bacterium]|nr:helix-turn-helix transcriptional regulator [Patescibacteria group bacterium]